MFLWKAVSKWHNGKSEQQLVGFVIIFFNFCNYVSVLNYINIFRFFILKNNYLEETGFFHCVIITVAIYTIDAFLRESQDTLSWKRPTRNTGSRSWSCHWSPQGTDQKITSVTVSGEWWIFQSTNTFKWDWIFSERSAVTKYLVKK